MPAWVFSAMFVGSVVLGRTIVFSGGISDSVARTYMRPLGALDLAILVVGVPLCALLVMVLAAAVDRANAVRTARTGIEDAPRMTPHRAVGLTVAIAALLLLAWSPYILTYAPGSVLPDSMGSLNARPGSWSNHHPIAFTLLVRVFAGAGEATGDINRGVFAFTLFQSLVMAGVLGAAVVWLAKRGVSRGWLAAIVAYFAVVPVFPIYAINMQKDTLFSAALLVLTMIVFDAVTSRGVGLRTARGIAGYLLASILVIFLKNNGVYIVAGTTLALWLTFRETMRPLVGSAMALLVAAMLLQGPGYDALSVERDTFVESVGVPLQQVAYVVVTGGSVTPSEQRYLDRLLPYELWPATYAPTNVDPLKWHPDFDEAYLSATRPQFLRTWAAVVARNPGRCFDAYCLQTFGFWKTGATHRYGFADTYVVENSLGVEPADLLERWTGFSAMPLLDGIRGPEGTSGFVSVGVLVWTVLLCATLLVLTGRSRFLAVLAPCALLWLTVMIATPVAFSLRYVFALALCFPGFPLLPFAGSDSETVTPLARMS